MKMEVGMPEENMEAGERISGNYGSRERETIKRGVVEKLPVSSTLIGKWLQGRGK
jgi:hypothetical protein